MGQAGDTAEVQITPEMIEEGVRAYLEQASHDEFSSFSPQQLVQRVLERALQSRKT